VEWYEALSSNPSTTWKKKKKDIAVHADLGKNIRPYLKNNESRKGGSMECLPSKYEALNSNTSTTKKKRTDLLHESLL
jgi:hypothetical protein